MESWKKVREFLVSKNKLLCVIDITEAFKNVRLEQVIIGFKLSNNANTGDYEFKIGDFWGDSIEIRGKATKSLIQKFDIIPIYCDNIKLKIYEKLTHGTVLLRDISKTFRGLGWQKFISDEGDIPILRGINIAKYKIYRNLAKIKVQPEEIKSSKVVKLRSPKIVSQNIIAHVNKPFDRLVIMATYDKDGLLTLDTVMNTIITNKNYSYFYILGILNSRLAEWYYYWFVYNRAIRTMHFDESYMGKLPIKIVNPQNQPIVKQIEDLVSQILSLTQSDDYEENLQKQAQVKNLEKQIDSLVYKLYGLTEEEIKIIEGGG